MSLYYISIHPDWTYSTVIVGKGKDIPQDYLKDNAGWIVHHANTKQYRVTKPFLNELVRYLNYLAEKDNDDCTFKIRDDSSQPWETLSDENKHRLS